MVYLAQLLMVPLPPMPPQMKSTSFTHTTLMEPPQYAAFIANHVHELATGSKI